MFQLKAKHQLQVHQVTKIRSYFSCFFDFDCNLSRQHISLPLVYILTIELMKIIDNFISIFEHVQIKTVQNVLPIRQFVNRVMPTIFSPLTFVLLVKLKENWTFIYKFYINIVLNIILEFFFFLSKSKNCVYNWIKMTTLK